MSDQPQPPSTPDWSGPPAGGPPPPGQPPAGGPPAGGPPAGGPPAGGPPGGGFAPPPAGGPPVGQPDGAYNIGAAFSYGWSKFTENLGPILIGMVLYFVVVGVFYAVTTLFTGLIGLAGGDSTAGFIGTALSSAIFGLVAVVGNFIIQAGITRAALAITYGQKPELNTILATDSLPQIAIGAIVLSIASSIGFFLCFIPGLIVVFFSQFFVHFALDKRLEWLDAIKASFTFVNNNLGTLIGFFLASMVAYIIGALACGIGILVALPVVIIAQAYTYRRLQGEAVAA